MQHAINLASNNKKTGKMLVTTAPSSTCAPTCPAKAICYAQYGPLGWHWQNVDEGTAANLGLWEDVLKAVRYQRKGALWRLNQAGDLPHHNGTIDRNLLGQLVAANRNRRGFTYTHHLLSAENIGALHDANKAGFTINVSTENVELADSVMTMLGLPAVAIVVSTEQRRAFRTASGRKVVVCPNVRDKNIQCVRCGLCAIADRDYIIAFPAHGVKKRTFDAVAQ